MTNDSSIPKIRTRPSTRSSEWGRLLLMLLDNKTFCFFFSGRNRLPFLVTMKIQPEFRWSDSIKMNLFLKAEEPAFLMARVLGTAKTFQKERKLHHIAPKYIAIRTSHTSTLSSRLFSVSILKVIKLLLSKTFFPWAITTSIFWSVYRQATGGMRKREQILVKFEEATKRDGQWWVRMEKANF